MSQSPSRSDNHLRDRREFLAQAGCTAGAAIIGGASGLLASEPGEEQAGLKPTTDTTGESISITHPELSKLGLCPLKIDYVAVKREYVELLKLVPEDLRYVWPHTASKVNGWYGIKAAFETSTPTESSEYFGWEEDERLGTQELEPLPWPDDQDFSLVKEWMSTNERFLTRLNEAINTADYISDVNVNHCDLVDFENIMNMDFFSKLRMAILKIGSRLRMAVRLNRWREAREIWEIGLNFSVLMLSGGGKREEYLIALSMRTIAISGIHVLVRQPEVPLRELERALKSLLEMPKIPLPINHLKKTLCETILSLIAYLPHSNNVSDTLLGMYRMAIKDSPFANSHTGCVPVAPSDNESRSDDRVLSMIQFMRPYAVHLLVLAEFFKNHAAPINKPATVREACKLTRMLIDQWQQEHSPDYTGALDWPEEYDLFLDLPPRTEITALDKILEVLAKHNYLQLEPELQANLTEEKARELIQKIGKVPNAVGKFILFHSAEFSVPIWGGIRNSELELNVAILRAAIKIHDMRFKRCPIRLDELVKMGILKELPLDPFSNRPFGYSVDEGIIWSVGRNGQGNGEMPSKPEDWPGTSEAWNQEVESTHSIYQVWANE
ncbi:MAG: hypothetical protein SFX18_08225 [Pirellulales bacterium]|nr:hypothetical protein [Pirellulales bacterium]